MLQFLRGSKVRFTLMIKKKTRHFPRHSFVRSLHSLLRIKLGYEELCARIHARTLILPKMLHLPSHISNFYSYIMNSTVTTP